MKYKLKVFLVQLLLLLCNLSNSEEDINKDDCFMVLNSKKDLLNISEDKGDGTVEIHYPLVNKTFIGVVTLLPNENPKNSEENKKICLKIQDEQDRNELKDLQEKIQDIIKKNNETEKYLEEPKENNVQLEKKSIEYKTYMRCIICKTDIYQTTDAFIHLGEYFVFPNSMEWFLLHLISKLLYELRIEFCIISN